MPGHAERADQSHQPEDPQTSSALERRRHAKGRGYNNQQQVEPRTAWERERAICGPPDPELSAKRQPDDPVQADTDRVSPGPECPLLQYEGRNDEECQESDRQLQTFRDALEP